MTEETINEFKPEAEEVSFEMEIEEMEQIGAAAILMSD